MRRSLLALWVLVLVPLVLAIASGGPTGLLPHAAFHFLYLPFGALAIVMALRLRSMSASRPVRGLALGLAVTQVLLVVGMIGEVIAVMSNGGFTSGAELFDDPLHTASANLLTQPGILLGLLVLICLTVAVTRETRATLRHTAERPSP